MPLTVQFFSQSKMGAHDQQLNIKGCSPEWFLSRSTNRLLTKSFATHSLTSAAKAAGENKTAIAALKRCATQNQVQHRLFPQPAKAFLSPPGVEHLRGHSLTGAPIFDWLKN